MDARRTGAGWDDVLEGMWRSFRAAGVRGADTWQRALGSGPFPGVSGLGSTTSRLLREGALPYGREVVGLTATYYRGLAEAAQDYLSTVADELLDRPPSPSPAAAVEVVHLHGPAGGEVSTTFTLANGDPDPATVTVTAGTCRSSDGDGFSVPVDIDPSRVELAPGASVAVVVRLRLDPQLFAAGSTYRIPLHVDGPQSSTIQLAITMAAEG